MRTITLTGDSTKDNKNITATFTTTAPIAEKNSRLALLACSAELPGITANELFTIEQGDNTFTSNSSTVTLAPGTYSFDAPTVPASFIKTVQAGVGLTGAPCQPLVGQNHGNHLLYKVVNGKSVFEEATYEYVAQPFNDATFYAVLSGAPTLSATGDFTANPAAACELVSLPDYEIPNGSYCWDWLNNSVAGAAPANDYAAGIGSSGAIWHGFSVVAGVYHAIIDGVAVNLALPYTSGDVMTIYRATNVVGVPSHVFWQITDLGGIVKYAFDQPITAQQWFDNFGGSVGGFATGFVINSPLGSTQEVFNVSGSLVGAAQVATSYPIAFNAGSKLEVYLGFNGQGPFSATGTPAQIISQNDVEGDNKFPPVELVLTGFQLETYTGSIIDRDAKSILYTITDTRTQSLRGVINPQIHNILKLDIKNPDTRLSNLGCYFRFPLGSLQKLEFTGTPIIVLGLYGPGEQ